MWVRYVILYICVYVFHFFEYWVGKFQGLYSMLLICVCVSMSLKGPFLPSFFFEILRNIPIPNATFPPNDLFNPTEIPNNHPASSTQ